jgi:hypothetical protein
LSDTVACGGVLVKEREAVRELVAMPDGSGEFEFSILVGNARAGGCRRSDRPLMSCAQLCFAPLGMVDRLVGAFERGREVAAPEK